MASRNPEIREIEHLLQVAKTAKDNSKTSSLENMLKLISDEQLEKDRELADALSTYLSKEALHAQLEAEVVELSEKHAVVKDINAKIKEIIAERQSFNEMYNIYSLKETEPKEFIQQHGNGIETLTNTLKALNEENDTLSEELKGIEEQNQLEMSKQTETINKIQRDIEESTENNKLLDEAINNSNDKLKQLKTEFEEKEKQRIAALDENKQQQELLEKKKPEIEDKEKEYATKEAELNEKHAEIDEKLEEIRMQADENKTINDNQSEILLRLQEELQELGKDLPEDFSLTQQNVDLQLEELQQNKQKLSELQSICESATITAETIEELDLKMVEVQEKLTSTQAEFDEIKNDLIKKETALNSELKL
ncbi:kinesin-like protein KIF15 [Atheta coriaria]|uniref:kinesin-like protein KIF15 n=1 Tax=Dalotia coriaria TaxID=877792 RepID=UPI0031F3C5D7